MATFFIYKKEINYIILSFIKFYSTYLLYTNNAQLIFNGNDLSFDLMIYINFNKDFEKYDNYILYCGDNHRILFDLYINHYINVINYKKYKFY